MNPERAVLAALAAGLLGLVYASITHYTYTVDPEHPYTALFVVFGVSLTLLAAAIIVPVQWLGLICILFVITGTPQIVGSMIRDGQRRRRLKADNRRQIQDTLQ